MIECLSDQQSNSDIVALSLFFHKCPLWHSASVFAIISNCCISSPISVCNNVKKKVWHELITQIVHALI